MSSVLSTQDIDDLRAAVSDLFPDRADVYHRSTAGSTSMGGSRPTYPGAPDLLQVPVLFGVRNAQELSKSGIDVTQVDQILTFPGGVDVRQTDRVIVGGLTWEVISVGGGGSWEVTKPVGLRRVS